MRKPKNVKVLIVPPLVKQMLGIEQIRTVMVTPEQAKAMGAK